MAEEESDVLELLIDSLEEDGKIALFIQKRGV
jgi:hypothetical protein